MKPAPYLLLLAACVSLHASIPCLTGKMAKRLAEGATGGVAVRARKIPMNSSVHAWEVLVHMPGERGGWAVIIDRDNSQVLRKRYIDNPPLRRER